MIVFEPLARSIIVPIDRFSTSPKFRHAPCEFAWCVKDLG